MKPKAFENVLLYAITDRRLSGKSHAEIVDLLVRGGCRLIQLREKTMLLEEFRKDAQEAVKVAKRFGATVIINDYVELVAELGAAGVHLGQDDTDVLRARSLLGKEALIGLSTHSLEQALCAEQLPVDYIAVGPIYGSSTKPEACIEGDGLELLRRVRPRVKKPIVAIGGITAAKARDVLSAGADLVAMISELMRCEDLSSQVIKVLEALHSYNMTE
ncbi:MAG: thiamine phosphate synthase [Acidobacteriota bacterium]|nr:thiamine phosphate synthase [Blastocatellia bacterium]MDW8412658.1 thiamine phosphate synthase [Acidobacteriota bacterium]